MITPEEISVIVAEKAELIRKARGSKGWLPEGYDHEKLPEFTPVYRKTVELYSRVRIHAVDGVFPDNLFREKAPNEKAEEFEYRKRLYKAVGSITHPYWERAQSKLNRIWNEKNYTIEIPEIEGVEWEGFSPADYFNKDYPEFQSLEAYFKSIVTVQKIADPNAWLAIDVIPRETDTEPVKPVCKIWGCERIWGFESGKYLLVKTDEKSVVKVGNVNKREGIVLRMYAADGIYRIEQYGRQLDYTFGDPELVYKFTEFKDLQAWPLRGKPQTEDNLVYFQSYFQPAVASLNSALIDANTLQISKIVNAFPERWEYVDDCDAEGCESGYIFDENREHRTACNSCGGTGRKNYSSPLSVIQVPMPKMANPLAADTSKDSMSIPPAGYLDKVGATEELRFLREEVIQEILDAFAMVHIDISNSDAKGSDTALGKQIDREELFTFLLQISSELFDLLGNAGNALGKIRYTTAWDKPITLGYPQNFAIRSDVELTMEIAEAKKAGIPDIAIQNMLDQYAETRFNSNSDTERVFDLVFKADRLISFTGTEVLAKLAAQTISKEQAILHDSIYFYIKRAEREVDGFWELEDQEKIDILNKYAADEVAKLAAPKLSAKEIIEQINAKKADAATELRGTVGGITAILGIIQAVGMGQYTPEAAIELLKTTYQFSDEEATAIIGNPPTPPDPVA